MDYNSAKKAKVDESSFIIQELLFQLASTIIPEELLRDGIDKETQAILFDVALATGIMLFIVFSDKCCFRIPNQRQLDLQRSALGEEAEYDELVQLSHEEIRELAAINRQRQRERKQ